MTALDDIEAAAKALNDLTAQEAAEKARIDAAVAAALAAIQNPMKVVYIDGVAGLDTNPGTSPVLAVKTPQAAAALVSAGQTARFVCCSDLILTATLFLAFDVQFESDTSAADPGVAVAKRKITVAPSAWSGTTLATPIGQPRARSLAFYDVDLHVGVISGAYGIIEPGNKVVFTNCAIGWDAGMTSPLIYAGDGLDASFLGSTSLQSDYPGKVFYGVSAGTNPNKALLRTNLTSA